MEKTVKIKVITLGDGSVGKTSILTRIQNGTFSEQTLQSTGNEKFYVKRKYEKKNIIIHLFFQDTAGQERFQQSLPKSFIRDSHIVLLVFCDIKTLNSLKERWFKFYKDNANLDISRFILVGNKSDIFGNEKEEIIRQGQEFADEINAHFITCSAKSKDNMDTLQQIIVNEAKGLIDLTVELLKEQNQNQSNNQNFNLNKRKVKKTNSGCC